MPCDNDCRVSPIERVEVIPLRSRSNTTDPMDTTASTVLVRLTDRDGRQGIGEADAPGSVVKAFLEMPAEHVWSQSISQLLLGADPTETTAVWERLYQATLYPGRRGLGIHALSAVDIAMHDLAGRQLGVPTYKLLGGARRSELHPYCTIYPGCEGTAHLSALIEQMEWQVDTAIRLGFRSLKLELIFGGLARDRELVEIVGQVRRRIGEDIRLALDFGYRWQNAYDARPTLNDLARFDIYFAEAVLPHDDLHGHARLAAASPIRICGAEFAATRWEVREWIEVGKVAVVQPDIARCGGLTEIRRIADMCEMYGVQVVPHGWKTGILVAATSHFHVAHTACPMFEFVSPQVYPSPLRADLTGPEPVVSNGVLPLPTGCGLGIRIQAGALERFKV